MATLTMQNVPEGGLANLTFENAAGGGDLIPAGGIRSTGGHDLESVVLIVRNADAATKTVTVAGGTPVVVPANTGQAVIPVPSGGLNSPGTAVAYSAATSVTVAAVRIGRGY